MPEEEKVDDILNHDFITARQLIIRLMGVKDLDSEIIIRDNEGKQLHNVHIVARAGIGALFG